MYFKAGLEILGTEGWIIAPSTMLKLCSEGANCCFICGDLDTMNSLIAQVIAQDIPVSEKFSVYEVKLQAAYAACNFDEAIKTGFDFRRQLGLPTPKNIPVHMLVIIKEFIKTKNAVGNRTAEDIARLPELTDDRIIMGQRMLELISTSCYQVSTIHEIRKVNALFTTLTFQTLHHYFPLKVQPSMFPLIVFYLGKLNKLGCVQSVYLIYHKFY